jgi:hypothetical protein
MQRTRVEHGGVISQGYGKNQQWRTGLNFDPSSSELKYRKILRIFDDPIRCRIRLKRMYHQCGEMYETSAKKGIHGDARR